ncbi:transglycosylase domain-containing protein [Salinibacterium sp. SWN1162]|uniref:transglycosylase domain-containing protein n=1 Tax=Salinibacterium sp. SWN1162 TaxID=2792053 RepID=UPI0018CC8DD4|nr:transglycosylase domain-containing protein [Salinibacterium sp. SWN1162]MBH0009822.1 transglycosylase domain-containing protein [Salinibacterium sp. SWN1162]
MSALKTPRRGILSAIAGLIGFSALSGVLVTAMVAPALAVTGITASSTIGIFDGLPDYLEIDQQPERNAIYAKYTGRGSVDGYYQIATIYDQNRQEVSFDEISPYAVEAVVAGEDRRFFEHGGVDLTSLLRAAVGNVVSSGIESGASTLTMQLVKNTFISAAESLPNEDDRAAAYENAIRTSFDRKLKEMKLAIGLEKRYTKKEILTAYLNIANFGNATYGIQAAAQRYYSVDAKDLNLEQSASLIAIVQEPSIRNLSDPEYFAANQDRRDVILSAMLDVGSIDRAEYDEAVAIPVDEETVIPSSPNNGCIAANQFSKWFCDYVVKSVPDFEFLGATVEERESNWEKGGYKLYTTLDLNAQIAAQQATWKYAPNDVTSFQLGSATSTVEAGTGRVLVMAENKLFNDTAEGGGKTSTAVNYNTSYDYGGSSGFQPGSTYKVFTLIEWLNQGKGIYDRLEGTARTMDGSQFVDSCNGPYSGPVVFGNNANETGTYTVAEGTAESVNGVFFSMASQLDQCNIRNVAASMGVERADGDELQSYPSSIIGTNDVTPLSMASAYAAIGAGGLWCEPIIIDKAIDAKNNDLGGQEKNCRQAISPEVAATTAFVLTEVLKRGNAAYSDPNDGIPIFGKTGTTDGAVHTWMASGTTRYGTATWVGNISGFQDISDVYYADVDGYKLRHYITNATDTALNKKYPGKALPEPDSKLLTGSGTDVPDVSLQSLEQARSVLTSLGFSFADGGQVDSELPAGQVVNTNPSAGTQSAFGATVTVYTSKGNKVEVPDVVGDGKSTDVATAQSILNNAGFNNLNQACEAVPPGDPRDGFVTAMNPGAGSFAKPDATVTVTVAQSTPCP